MDIRQVEEQLALLLANCLFSDAPGGAILKSVTITREPIGALISAWLSTARKDCPFVILRVTGGRNDPDSATHPSGSMGVGVRKTFRASVVVVAGSISDPVPSPPPFVGVGNVTGDDVHGQGAIIGKTVVIGTQAGQGVDRIGPEVERQAFGNGQLVDQVHGLAGRVVGVGDLQSVFGSQLLGRRIDLEITNGSTGQSYHAPIRFKGVAAAGTVTLTWLAVPARPDFVQYVVKRDGVTKYTGPLLTFADAGVAAGAHTYTIVAQYDDVNRPATTANRSSQTVTLPVTV